MTGARGSNAPSILLFVENCDYRAGKSVVITDIGDCGTIDTIRQDEVDGLVRKNGVRVHRAIQGVCCVPSDQDRWQYSGALLTGSTRLDTESPCLKDQWSSSPVLDGIQGDICLIELHGEGEKLRVRAWWSDHIGGRGCWQGRCDGRQCECQCLIHNVMMMVMVLPLL